MRPAPTSDSLEPLAFQIDAACPQGMPHFHLLGKLKENEGYNLFVTGPPLAGQ